MFPGVFTPDSFFTIKQARSQIPLDDFHTITYTLVVKMLTLNGTYLWILTALQIALNIIALWFVIRSLKLFKSRSQELTTTSVLFCLPFFGPFSATFWKDSLYNPLVVIGLIGILKNCLRTNAVNTFDRKKKIVIFFYSSLLTLGSLLRHEGFVILASFAILLFVLSMILKQFRNLRLASCSFFACSLSCILLSTLMINVTDAKKVPSYQRTVSFLLDLQYVNATRPDLLESKTKSILDQISTDKSLSGAANCSGPFGFWDFGFNEQQANLRSSEIPLLWLKTARSDARETMFEGRFCRLKSIMPPIFSNTPTQGYWPTTGIGFNELGIDHGTIGNTFYPAGYSWSYLWRNNGNFVAWPGLHLGLIFLLIIFNSRVREVYRRNHVIFIGVISFVLLRFLALSITVASQEYRYYYLVYLVSMPLLTLAIYDSLNSKKAKLRNVGPKDV
jgi:hypothetical protein